MSRRNRVVGSTLRVPSGALRRAAPTAGAALVVLKGPESDLGRHIVIENAITVGRDPRVELPLDDAQISRRHCRVVRDKTDFLLEDLKSTNGTRLNGKLVHGPQRLRPGDCIALGDCVIKFTAAGDLDLGYHAQMDARVSFDELTGLVAKRRFEPALTRALAAARAQRQPLIVLAIDLDGLKAINDTHGHPIGSNTIAQLGKIIGSFLPSGSMACRTGGDEFVLFLGGQTRAQAIEWAERLRRHFAAERFEQNRVVVKASISIGLACFPADGRTEDELLAHADQALYRAKRQGRNRISTS